MHATAPTIDMSELLASPAAWLCELAAAVARDDAARIGYAQTRLQELGWIALSPENVARLERAQASARQADETTPPTEPAPEPER